MGLVRAGVVRRHLGIYTKLQQFITNGGCVPGDETERNGADDHREAHEDAEEQYYQAFNVGVLHRRTLRD